MLRYFVGRSSEDKTNSIYEEIKKGIEGGFTGSVIVMVPEQFSIQMEYDLMKKMDLPGIMNIDVLSFKRLGYRVFSEVGGDAGTVIDSVGRKMLLQKAFEDKKDDLAVFGQVYRRAGFIEAFETFVKEMKRAQIEPSDFLSESEKRESEKLLSGKLSDIHKIYETYEGLLTEEYYDEEDEMNLLISLIGQATFLKDAVIYVDHFYGFTEQEYAVLEAMLSMVKSMTITLPIDPSLSSDDKDLFYPTYRIFEKMERIASGLGIERKKRTFDSQVPVQGLEHLKKYLFSYDSPKGLDSSGISLIQSQNQYLEVERVAFDIVQKIKSGNYSYSDISLSVSDMNRYAMTIKSVFDEFGIPYFIDEKVNIGLHPLVVYISALFRVSEKYYRSEDLIKLLKSGYIDLSSDTCQRLENFIIEKGIQGKRVLKDFDDDLMEDLTTFLDGVKAFEKEAKGKRSVEAFSKLLVEHLLQMKIVDKLNDQVEAFKSENKLEKAREYAQVWNALMNILDQMVRLIGDLVLDVKDFSILLLSGISSKKIGLMPEGRDQIIVGDLARSRNKAIKGLYLLGVNDGVLPMVRDSGGILMDDEVMMLIEDGFKLNSSVETFIKEERLSIYATLIKPSEFLVVSYPVSDLDGKAQRPSHLIHQIRGLFEDLPIEKVDYDYFDSLKTEGLTINPAIRYMVDALRKEKDGMTVDDKFLAMNQWLKADENYEGLLDKLNDALVFDNHIKPLSLDHVDHLFSMDAKTSISRLERFEQCPFSHFVDYGLNPHIRKQFELQSPELGSIYHFVIESFGEILNKEKLSWKDIDANDLDRYIDTLMDDSLERHKDLFDSSFYYKFIKVKIRRVLNRTLKTLTDQVKKGAFEPTGFELSFPSMVVPLEGGRNLTIQGKIDRVDLLDQDGKGYIKIIDYKSGQKSFDLSNVYQGLDLQLMVYLMGAMDISESLYGNTLNPGGAFYFKIDDPLLETTEENKEVLNNTVESIMKLDGLVLADDSVITAMDEDYADGNASELLGVKKKKGKDEFTKTSNALDEKTFKKLLDHVIDNVKGTGEKILSGDIAAQPVKQGQSMACDYCPYKSVCQFDLGFKGNKVNFVKKLDKDQIIEKLNTEKGGEGDA